MSEVKTIVLPPLTERQTAAWEALRTHQYTFYGGSASGGKSWFLRHAAVRFLISLFQEKQLKGVVVGLFCEDYPSLEDRQIKRIRAEFPPELGKLNESRHEFILSPQVGGGIVVCRNLDDPSRYMSSEFAAIFVDELTKNDRETFDILRSRMRWPGIKRPRFVGASNPIGPGVEWVKRLWIQPDFRNEPIALNPREFAFVPAKASDNPHIDPDYADKQLASQPEHIRKALLDGSWDYVQGAYFTEWKHEIHVKPRHEPDQKLDDGTPLTDEWGCPVGCRKVGGVDWGRAAPWAALAAYVDPDGRLVVYAGVAEAGWEHERQSRWMQQFPGTTWYADDACFAKGAANSMQARAKDMSHVELWQQAANGRLAIMPARKGDRVAGWQHVAAMLKPIPNDPQRAWIEFWDVEGLKGEHGIITTLPLVVKDPNKPEDVDSDGDDHAADSLRYLCLSRPAPVKVEKPTHIKLQKGDYTSYRDQLQAAEQDDGQEAVDNGW